MIKAVVWNYRGARKKEALDRCRVMIKELKMDMLALLETHTSWDEAEQVTRSLGCCWAWFAILAQGKSRGILVLWKKDIGWVDVAAISRYATHLTVTLQTGQTWIWSMVYASNHLDAQKELWEELLSMAMTDTPWILTGDFNAFLSPQEKRCSGGVELGPKCKAFVKFVDDAGLCDLGYEGVPYT
ncbi:uncharacterized protein [Typha angustifolia]|uniref:uncharacterized protein n=1 Tax=Typha angustifolia TaxID=59011 RepID=UPI003C2D2DA8